ncbi:hypothetical protein [Actinoplanes sp. NPDC049599]|uniref:hypothetical protein n=1 Tax=Actinoplanes sp. NPDC049599 TaxID=3363903 RepID=UPI0037A6847E
MTETYSDPRVRRSRPLVAHRFRADPATPGVCLSCPLIEKNAVHDPVAVAAVAAAAHEAQAEERRRLGERED